MEDSDIKEETKEQEEEVPLQDTSRTPEEKLADLGYVIHKEGPNDYGRLRQKDDVSKGLEWKGQKNYDEIGALTYEYVQRQMVEQYGLKEIWIPEDKDLEEDYRHLPRSNIYMSPDFLPSYEGSDKKERALILIQGTGAVRAG